MGHFRNQLGEKMLNVSFKKMLRMGMGPGLVIILQI